MNSASRLPIPQPSEPHVWIGGPLRLRQPSAGPDIHRVRLPAERLDALRAAVGKLGGLVLEPRPVCAEVLSGAPVQVVARAEGGILAAFPPAPFLLKLTPEHYAMLHPPESRASKAPPLTPEGLLAVLQHPQIVPMIQHLVATQPDAAKAAALPLVQPLIAAFAAPEHMPLIRTALTSFGIRA